MTHSVTFNVKIIRLYSKITNQRYQIMDKGKNTKK